MDEKIQTSAVFSPGQAGVLALSLPVTESLKSLETVQRVWDFFFESGLTRRGLVIAVGGGVITDLVGFAAFTYMRGVDYLNVPTTLLAMVDASTGGKTGFNYHGLKNSIGAFAEPIETLVWPGWLPTLPADQFLSGFAEMLKMGVIVDRLWDALLAYDLDTMPMDELTPLIEACMAAKEQIVAADPHEDGLRKVLNFGHTFGHALEEIQMVHGTWSNSTLPHGYAVLYGMIAELYLSVVKLGCSKEPLRQLTRLMLHYYGKPQCKCSDLNALIALMQQDKKNERTAEINCTLLRSIGDPVINRTISPSEALEALDYLFSL
jgi:3-dehydroquinate synthase